MVWLCVVAWLIMGSIAVCGDVFMANRFYSQRYRDSMKNDRSNIAAMIGCCLFFWFLVIPFQLAYMLASKIEKAYK